MPRRRARLSSKRHRSRKTKSTVLSTDCCPPRAASGRLRGCKFAHHHDAHTLSSLPSAAYKSGASFSEWQVKWEGRPLFPSNGTAGTHRAAHANKVALSQSQSRRRGLVCVMLTARNPTRQMSAILSRWTGACSTLLRTILGRAAWSAWRAEAWKIGPCRREVETMAAQCSGEYNGSDVAS